jgi:hypothetical protein
VRAGASAAGATASGHMFRAGRGGEAGLVARLTGRHTPVACSMLPGEAVASTGGMRLRWAERPGSSPLAPDGGVNDPIAQPSWASLTG